MVRAGLLIDTGKTSKCYKVSQNYTAMLAASKTTAIAEVLIGE